MKNKITKQERITINKRRFILQGFFGVVFGGIFLRLWNLQIVRGAEYKKLSDANHIRLLYVGGLRGLIYDKQNKVVAKNILSYNLYGSSRKWSQLEKVMRKVSVTLGIPYKSLRANFEFNLKISPYSNVKVYDGLTWEQVSLIEAYQEEFSNVYINVSQIRHYLFSNYFAPFIGYTNLIDKEELKKISKDKIESAYFFGKSGVEKSYNDQLIGRDGKIRIEINSANKIISSQYLSPSQKGNNIYLNIDSDLQIKLYKVFQKRKGAAVVMNPHNGKVLAMCSNPSFDANRFSSFLSPENWEKILKDNKGVFNNRCIQGLYSPGSTFKMLIAIAALEEGIIDENYEYTCRGNLKVNRKIYYCWKKSGHKKIGIIQAIAQSCNTFFYQLGLELGVDKIYEYAVKMGFNAPTNIDIPNEKSGIIPNKEWKKRVHNDRWYFGETVGVSIGQNYVSTTPLQLLCYVNAIINGGSLIEPRIVDYIQQKEKKVIPLQAKKLTRIKPEYLNMMLEGMRSSVTSSDGTNRILKNSNFTSGGKTGTTEVINSQTKRRILKEKGQLDPSLENHAWFTGFAPAHNPKYSIVVLIENGKKGTNAALLAKEIFYHYFQQS